MGRVEKVANIWLTENSLRNNFPQNCVVECSATSITMKENYPLIIKKTNDPCRYEVYAKNKDSYVEIKTMIVNKGNFFDEEM